MKKILFTLLLVIANIMIMKADPLYLDSICIVQPSGDTLWSRLQGDEFYHWRSTVDGHVIMRDSNHCFYYAQIAGDTILQPSTIIAHNVEDRTPLEREYLNLFSGSVKDFIFSEIQKAHMIEQSDTTLIPHAQYAASNTQKQPVIGTRKVLTILVEFEDRPFSLEKAEFDSLMNQRSDVVGLNYGSVRQYYQENSYGQLTIESTVIGPIEISGSYTKYQQKNEDNYINTKQLVRRAIDQAKDMVDFSTLDGDNDGHVDCVHIVYAGSLYMNSSTDIFIWPHKGEVSGDRTSARDYIITPELNRNGAIAPMGTICHELGHILGAPDFYDSKHLLHPMGKYDVMDGGHENGKNIYGGVDQESGYCPAHHNPYTKCYIFKWDTPTLIHPYHRTYLLSSSTKNKGHVYRINTKTPGEYFLLENRTREGFNGDIPNGGLLIYHAHADLETCIEDHDSINAEQPMKFYLINADASTNVEPTYGLSDSQRAYPGDNHDKTMFTSTTTPSAKAWDGRDFGVDICFIKQLDYGRLSFTVNPRIMGSSQLCGIQDYSVVSELPENDIVEWSYSTDIAESSRYPALRFMDGTEGNMVTLKRGNTIELIGPIIPEDTTMQMATYGMIRPVENPGVPHVGTATLYATVTSGNGTYQMEKEIELPEYVTPSLAPSYTLWPINTERTLSDTSCINIEPEHIKWYVRYPNSMAENVYTGHDVTLIPTEAGEMTVRIVNDCGCEASNKATYTYTVVNTGPMSYPNPVTTSILPIDIMRYDDSTLYTVELWHQTYGRKGIHSTTGNRVEFDVSDLPTDWYQLVLHRSGQILDSGSVYIQH